MTLANILKKKLEPYVQYVGYFPLCVTLQPALYKFCASKQLKLTLDKLVAFCRMFCSNIVCVAELTARINIHYHLLVKWSELNKYSRELFEDTIKTSTMFGNIKISPILKTVGESERYINYVLKEVEKTDSIINAKRKNPIKIYRFSKKKISSNTIDQNQWLDVTHAEQPVQSVDQLDAIIDAL